MKNFLLLIGVAAIMLAAVPTRAQDARYAAQALISNPGIYTNAAGSSATNYNALIDCRKQAKVAVQITQTYSTAGTAPTVYIFQRSVDGVTWDNSGTNGQTVYLTGAGNTPTTLITNLDSLGCGYIRLAWATNTSAVGVSLTNLSVMYGIKMNAP